MDEDYSTGMHSINWKAKYKALKRNVRYLAYEEMYYRTQLKKLQKKLLVVRRDVEFLLQQLAQSSEEVLSDEDTTDTNSEDEDSDVTVTSDDASNVPARAPTTVPKIEKKMSESARFMTPASGSKLGALPSSLPSSNVDESPLESEQLKRAKSRAKQCSSGSVATTGPPPAKKRRARHSGSAQSNLSTEDSSAHSASAEAALATESLKNIEFSSINS